MANEDQLTFFIRSMWIGINGVLKIQMKKFI